MLRLLINLDRSPDRLEWMRSEFARLGLDFERVSGVDAEEASRAAAQFARPRPDGHAWAMGEIGCFLSHRKCWEIAAGSRESHIAIFEDDINLAPAAARFLRDTAWIPPDIDVVKLETYRHITRLRGGPSIGDGYRLAELKSRHFGSAGYIITRSAAQRLLDSSSEFDCTVDIHIFEWIAPENPLRRYQLNPAICIQEDIMRRKSSQLPSVIESERSGVRKPETKPVGFDKAWREIARPFKRFGNRSAHALIYLASGERNVKVPYAGEWRGEGVEIDTQRSPNG